MKQFAYCIGGCRSVPPYLDCLTTDNSDCFPVFFKAPGPTGSIYFPKSTTNTGRNAAFAEARKGDYEYVIIMDDDVSFAHLTNAEGFRKFESLLNEFKPAIATPRYGWHLKGFNPKNATNLKKRIQGISATDACMNAFHRDVWWSLLPYWTEDDSASWWNAAHVLHRVALFLYPGQFVQFNELHLINGSTYTGQMPYPKDGRCVAADKMMLEMLKPDWKAHYEMHDSHESFTERFPVLKDSYKVTREEAGRYFNLDHPYWKAR
jgi:hypothetical protein